MTRIPPLSLATAICLTMAVQPCAAQAARTHEVFALDPAHVVHATAVDYSDLDLSSTKGLQSLLARIEGAAEAVCGGGGDSRAARQDQSQCRKAAVARGVKQMNLPRLRTLAAARQARLAAAD
jgi:UrcA family protein